jgi:large subunit ribosomal protein L21e
MLKRKPIRQKGKLSFTRFFQKFKEGDSVAVVKDLGVKFGYSNRLQGKTGKVIKKQGSAYEVQILDINKSKKYLIKPIHLKPIQDMKGVSSK